MYCRVVELRDLFWVQELMLEKQLPPPAYADLVLEIRELLGDVQTIITAIENSMIYIKWLAERSGQIVDFGDVEIRRRNRRPRNHPCSLLLPYMVEFPISGTTPPQWPPRPKRGNLALRKRS